MPESIDQQLAVADVYAASLFQIASENGDVDAVRAELEEFCRIQSADPDFAEFMASSAIDSERRATSLEKVFRGRLSDSVLNMLLIMNRNGRGALVAQVLRRFIARHEDAVGQVEVTVTSAVELDEGQCAAVTERAADLSGRTPVIEWAVDPKIIGGLVIKVGDLRYDNSIRQQLAGIRSTLLERSQRGLAITPDE